MTAAERLDRLCSELMSCAGDAKRALRGPDFAQMEDAAAGAQSAARAILTQLERARQEAKRERKAVGW